ncbi:hypothetical protein ACFL7M_14540 [Thermodesulfobacteriota bacterium]
MNRSIAVIAAFLVIMTATGYASSRQADSFTGSSLIRVLDSHKGGMLSKGEFSGPVNVLKSPDKEDGGFIVSIEVPSRGLLVSASASGNRRPSRIDKAPKVGDIAPTFKLMSLDGKQAFDLEKYRGKRPVVLFFGSYT